MTTLSITPNWKQKTAKFRGAIAAGEHVAVSIANDDGTGNAFISSTANLRLSVIDPTTGRLLATFPEPVEEGETPDTWGNDPTPLACTLNLNTVQMLKAVPPAANVQLLFVLDAYNEETPEFTLYFKDMCEVTHWPRRVGEEEPVDLDGYKDFVEETEAAIEAFGVRIAAAETSVTVAERAATNAAQDAERSAASAASSAQTAAAVASGKVDKAELFDNPGSVGQKVKATWLPSYVDDVLEFASRSGFPASGEGGKIYIALDTGKVYRWGGSEYVEIANPDLSGYKTKQTAVPDPTASGTGLAFIDSITQNANGEITVTKKTVAVDAALSASSEKPVANKTVKAAVDALDSAKQNALSAAQLANISAVPGKADKAELPYALAAAEKSNGAYALADRTVSYHTLDTEPGIDFSGTPSISGYIQQDGHDGFFPITSTEVIDFNELRCIIKANYDGGYVYVEAPPLNSDYPRAFEVSGTDEYLRVVAEWDVTGDSHSPFWGSGTAYPSMSSVELQCANGMTVFIPVKWGEVTVPLSFPAATSRKSRDFYFALNVPSGATAPTVTAPGGVTLLNEFGAAFSFAIASGWNVWHFTEFSPGLFRVESCGGASAIKAALDGKQATLTSAQLAAIAAVPDKADKSELPYALGMPTTIDTASSETVEGETVYYGAATLDNRTANIVQVTAATALDELRLTFPAAVSGKVRDFGLRVEIGTGSAALAAPAIVPVAPTGETITLENADGAIPALADGTATAKGVTLLYFSETAPMVFVVKGEEAKEVE